MHPHLFHLAPYALQAREIRRFADFVRYQQLPNRSKVVWWRDATGRPRPVNEAQKHAGYDIATDCGALRYCRVHATYYAGDMDPDFEDIRALYQARLGRGHAADEFDSPAQVIAIVLYLVTEHTNSRCPVCAAELSGMLGGSRVQ